MESDDDESDAGSEDLEAESSVSEDEEDEVEDADEEMDMVRHLPKRRTQSPFLLTGLTHPTCIAESQS